MLSPLATPGRFGDLPRHLSVSTSKKRASMSPTKAGATSIPTFRPTKRRRIDDSEPPETFCTQRKSPFQDFPAFLVVGVFPMLSLADRISALHVSRNWRNAFRSSPLVWQDLSIGFSVRSNPDLAWLLALSKELPVRLDLDVRARTSLVHWLPESIRRVQELDISALLRLPAAGELCLTHGGWTSLVSLSLVVPRPHNNPYVLPRDLFNCDAPLLEDVRLENVHFPEGDAGTIIAFANVRVLSYTRCDAMSVHTLSCLLEHFPSLRCLSLSVKLSANADGPARVSSLSPHLACVTILRPSSRLVSLFLDCAAFPILEDLDIPECSMGLLNQLPIREMHFKRNGAVFMYFSAGQLLRVARLKTAPNILLSANLISHLLHLSLPSYLVPDVHVDEPDVLPAQPDYALLLHVRAPPGINPAAQALVEAIGRVGRTVILT